MLECFSTYLKKYTILRLEDKLHIDICDEITR